MYPRKQYIALLKYTLIFVVMFILWTFFIHESMHALACLLQGGSPAYTFVGIKPSAPCMGIEHIGQAGRFLVLIAPYIFDLVVLAGFLFLRRSNIIMKLIPHVALADTLGNYFFSNILHRQNDFTILAAEVPSFFWLSVAVVLGMVVVWVFGYWKELNGLAEFVMSHDNE